jgi:cysteine desulfurase
MNKNIYLDHAATTYVKKEVLNEMMPYFSKKFGNPSAIYKLGDENKNIVNLARERVARALNAKPTEIYFTGCGSESDNWALKGIAFANKDKGNHIITTCIEHAAILKSCEFLEKLGFEITYLSVDKYGRIDLDELKNTIKETTILISVMFANNEIGTIEPVKEIAQIAKEHNIYFHTDAVQAVGNVKIDVKELGVDMLSLSGHKLYGPKGIGALYIKEGTNIEKLIHGGGQELGKRAGTENVPSIVGLGKAMEIAYRDFDKNNSKILALREYFITEVERRIPDVKLNGHRELRLPGNINFSFNGVDGGTLLEMLNLHGISASSGSACSARNVKPSHVLKAIGLDDNTIKSSLRFSLGVENTKGDIDYVLTILEKEVYKLRKI